jgi:F-type H+-transporting ATPase subunit delta
MSEFAIKAGQDITIAKVTTAIPLSDDDKAKLEEYLTAYFGHRIIVEKPEVDPSLIGGIIVKVDRKLVDGSIRSRLAALKRQLTSING